MEKRADGRQFIALSAKTWQPFVFAGLCAFQLSVSNVRCLQSSKQSKRPQGWNPLATGTLRNLVMNKILRLVF
jgi:hypothetical protein